MTIAATSERFIGLNSELFKKRPALAIKKLSQFVARQSATLVPEYTVNPTLDPKVVNDLELIRELPDEQIDRRLALSSSIADGWRVNTGDIPAVIAHEVQVDAEKMVDTWGIRDHKTQSIRSLGEAYDITGDHNLLEKALDVVHASPDVVGLWPSIARALEQTSENGDGFQENLTKIDSKREEISHPAPQNDIAADSSPLNYSWLYEKTTR